MANMGRPTKLTPARLKKAQAYLNSKKRDKECPFVEQLAIYELDVHRHTIENWCNNAEDKEWLAKQNPRTRKLYADFLSTIKKLSDMQLLYLKVTGLKEGRNAVAIFLMKANHQMVETSRTELTGAGGGPVRFKPVEVMSIKNRGVPQADNDED